MLFCTKKEASVLEQENVNVREIMMGVTEESSSKVRRHVLA